ncbi:hypothetical protein LIER_17512 [Lithospermum erythrorhizon]|uniref:Uncharacterized protein n=1 Tax=Lithospermum erythrorhizon TaxID=34254 RepID=A0AAV3QEZ1_LITER
MLASATTRQDTWQQRDTPLVRHVGYHVAHMCHMMLSFWAGPTSLGSRLHWAALLLGHSLHRFGLTGLSSSIFGLVLAH